jgi:hypothetical protein
MSTIELLKIKNRMTIKARVNIDEVKKTRKSLNLPVTEMLTKNKTHKSFILSITKILTVKELLPY